MGFEVSFFPNIRRDGLKKIRIEAPAPVKEHGYGLSLR
jgi:hypothetical protein